MRAGFTWNLSQLLSNKLYRPRHFATTSYWKWQHYAVSTKATPFLSILSIVFTGSLLVSLKRASLFGDEMRMQTCRWTELLQMLGVTTNGSHSHVGSQALGEVRHRFGALLSLTCSCGISSQMACKATFNSSVVLCFGWSLWYFSSMVPQMWQSSRSNLESFEATTLLNQPETVHLVLQDARTL